MISSFGTYSDMAVFTTRFYYDGFHYELWQFPYTDSNLANDYGHINEMWYGGYGPT